jgi:murein DD-endopeptidase MepM/ murein hydrolase activator NlpD
MQRKTLSERLTNKHQLIVRSDENFADKWSLSFSYAQVLVIGVLVLILLYVLFTSVNSFIGYLMGSGDELEKNKQVIVMAAKVDSLEYEIQLKDQYIMGFKNILEGGVSKVPDSVRKSMPKVSMEETSEVDVEFRKKFEKDMAYVNYIARDGFTGLYFSPPLQGKITKKFDPKNKVKGVEISSAKRNIVKSIEEGTVLFVDSSRLSGYDMGIQHKSGLITIYRGINSLIKKTPEQVNAGEPITTAENDKLFFEMWYSGKPLNPEDYVSFK